MPIEQFIKDEKSEDLETIRADIAEELDGIYDTVFRKTLSSQLLQDLIADRKPLYFGPAWGAVRRSRQTGERD